MDWVKVCVDCSTELTNSLPVNTDEAKSNKNKPAKNEKVVTIAIFYSLLEAEVRKSKLESEGIKEYCF